MPEIIHNFRDDSRLREQFYNFIQVIFPWADFRTWYELGFWSDKYIPYSIVEDNRIVANVSASRMEVIINGKARRGLQLGTVGTIPDYRGRGHSRLLMEYVLDRYRREVDTLYLFANESVTDFYTRFGFEQKQESIFRKRQTLSNSRFDAQVLSYEDENDRAIVKRLLATRCPLTERFGARNYDFVFYWHWINVFPDRLFYLENEDLLLITTEGNGLLRVYDVICEKPINLSGYLERALRADKIDTIEFCFPPDVYRFEFDETVFDDSLLFVQGDFNSGDKPVKYPSTAQT